MRLSKKHIDPASLVVILITLVLFVGALFTKGLTHDLLLEGGVLLVSVKLIMMAYKNSVTADELKMRLDKIQMSITQLNSPEHDEPVAGRADLPEGD